MTTDKRLKRIFRAHDPAGSLPQSRLARLESAIIERALITPQEAPAFTGGRRVMAPISSLSLWPGILAACVLVLLGIATGQNLLPVYSSLPGGDFSVVSMSSPWQNLLSAQGEIRP